MIVLITSIVSLVLTFQNFAEASYGANVTRLALLRLNNLRIIRPSFRTLVNMANGLQNTSTDVISNRVEFYIEIVDRNIEEMRQAQKELEALGTISAI